jgi:hypothetical protein
MIDKIKSIVCQDCQHKTQPLRGVRSEGEVRQVTNMILSGDLKITLEEFIQWIKREREIEL